MIPLMPLLAAVLSLLTSVNGLGLAPVNGRTELTIRLDGTVTSVKDYRLGDPDRLVIDITGSRSTLPGSRFDRLDRGGISAVRVSQFQPEVVRVVVDLKQRVDYRVEQGEGEIRVSFQNPAGDFEPWSIGAGTKPLASRSAPPPAVRRAPAVPRITASFQKTPILEVLTTFAEFSGKSIVAGSEVTGDITADIRNQPWDVALQAILRAQGLSSVELESGIIQVEKMDKARDREKTEELVTRNYKIKYVPVDSLLPAIKGLISTDRGKVTTSPATNTLVVTDGKSVIDRLGPLIEQLDARTAQVSIAAKILFVDRTALEGLGVVYDLKDSRGNQLNSFTQGLVDQNGDGVLDNTESTSKDWVLLGGNSIAALANATNRLPGAALQAITSLVLGRHTLISFIEALQSLVLSDIQAAPVVTVMDNREALIQVGEETPIRVVDVGTMTQGGGQGGLQAPRATVNMKRTGVILQVTPHVTGDHVLLQMHAERSQVVPGVGDAGVTFSEQVAETQVLVKDGETAVVGGLTLIEKIRERTGIPVLMDVPLLGALFRKTSNSEHKRDLLILVTPHIIAGQ